MKDSRVSIGSSVYFSPKNVMSLVTKPFTISRIRTYEHHYTYRDPRSVWKRNRRRISVDAVCSITDSRRLDERERKRRVAPLQLGCCWNIFCTKALATTGVVGPACRCSERACKFQNLSSQWKAPRCSLARRLQPSAIDLPCSRSCSSSLLRFSILHSQKSHRAFAAWLRIRARDKVS